MSNPALSKSKSFIVVPDLYLASVCCTMRQFVERNTVQPFEVDRVDVRVIEEVRRLVMRHVDEVAPLVMRVPLPSDVIIEQRVTGATAVLFARWISVRGLSEFVPIDVRPDIGGSTQLMAKMRTNGLPIVWSASVPLNLIPAIIRLRPHVFPLPFLAGTGERFRSLAPFVVPLLERAGLSCEIALDATPLKDRERMACVVRDPSSPRDTPEYRFLSDAHPVPSKPPPDDLDGDWDVKS